MNDSLRLRIPAVFSVLAGLSTPAFAQIKVDETLLWEQRLFETERAREGNRPLELKVYGGMKYDSNLFRLSPDENAEATIGSADKSDYIYQLGAGGRYEMQWSRQKLVLEGAVEQYWFQNFNQLDNTANLARAEWIWHAGNDWWGTVGFGHRYHLENFGNVQDDVRDMVTRNRVYGSANYRPLSYLRFTVDLDTNEEEHSADERQALDYESKGGAFTTAWVTPSDNSVGVKLRTADTTYPNGFAFGAAGDNSYRENEYSLVSVWHVTAASVLKGRLGHTERKFDQGGDRDFSGPTWRLGYEWEPTGKTALEIAIWRELSGFEDLSGNYMRSTGIGFFPAWSALPKLILQAKAAYQTRAYLGDVLTPSGVPREDQERVFQIAAVWTPLRMTKLIVAIETGDRNSNQPLADYEYHSVGLAAIRTF